MGSFESASSRRFGAPRLCCWAILIAAVAAALANPADATAAAKVLRVVPHSNLTIIDPIWTTAIISQTHGYMIYDTLFAPDASGVVQPQMVERYSSSRDGTEWTFTLRDGLEFHDGQPVKSEDVLASLRRWGERDVMGQRLLANVQAMEVVDATTFRIRLKGPYPFVLETLGKATNAPFVMPRRIADTPADKQIDDATGSGPFIFSKDEWKPGEKVVYLRNPRYRPRSEPSSGLAGAKIVKVDRVEWVIIKDPQTQVNALAAGEVDVVEAAAHESFARLKANPDIQLETVPLRRQVVLRFNHLQPPFDNPKIRRAAMAALDQAPVLRTQVGVAEMYSTCFSVYPCAGPLATTKGLESVGHGDAKSARELLRAAGYDGTPLVVMQPTDQAVLAKFPVMATQLLRQAGFKVDLQAMDWQTLVSRRAKKDAPAKGGWNAFITNFPVLDVADPVVHVVMAATCEKAWFGWPCDPELERLRDEFARSGSVSERKALAEQVQVRAMEVGTYVPLGEYYTPKAFRREVRGLIQGFYLVLWNAEKQ